MNDDGRSDEPFLRRRPRRPRPVTLKAVASDAGVSVTTVSHVVNKTRFVEDETLRRVQASIAKLGYSPNRLARGLRRNSTDSIGLIVSDIGNPYYTDVIRGVDEECRRLGMTVLLAGSDDDPARESDALVALRSQQVDGLIVALTSGTTDHVVSEISNYDLPVVLVDRLADAPIDQVGTENHDSMIALVEHLIEGGHRTIGFVSGVEGISTSDERVQGYRHALKRHGIPFDSRLVANGQSRVEPARQAAAAILDAVPDCTALVAANNLMVLGVLKAAADRTLGVPQDVAVVGFDDFEWTDVLHPRLTTMAQPNYEIGREAIRLLLRRRDQPDVPPETIRLQPTFMHRDSCGCVARPEK